MPLFKHSRDGLCPRTWEMAHRDLWQVFPEGQRHTQWKSGGKSIAAEGMTDARTRRHERAQCSPGRPDGCHIFAVFTDQVAIDRGAAWLLTAREIGTPWSQNTGLGPHPFPRRCQKWIAPAPLPLWVCDPASQPPSVLSS